MPEYSKFPFMIECKNQEKVQLWQFWNQARDQATPGNREPVLVVSGNHRPILAIMEIDTLLNLQKTVNDLEETIKTLKSD